MICAKCSKEIKKVECFYSKYQGWICEDCHADEVAAKKLQDMRKKK